MLYHYVVVVDGIIPCTGDETVGHGIKVFALAHEVCALVDEFTSRHGMVLLAVVKRHLQCVGRNKDKRHHVAMTRQ